MLVIVSFLYLGCLKIFYVYFLSNLCSSSYYFTQIAQEHNSGHVFIANGIISSFLSVNSLNSS